MLRSWQVNKSFITESQHSRQHDVSQRMRNCRCQPTYAQLSLMGFQVDHPQLEIPPEVKSPCEPGVLPDMFRRVHVD